MTSTGRIAHHSHLLGKEEAMEDRLGILREPTIVPRITADEAGLRLESSATIPPAAPRTLNWSS